MSVPSMTPHRIVQSTRDYTAIDAYARDAIDAYEYLRARAVPDHATGGVIGISIMVGVVALVAAMLACGGVL